MGRPDVAGGRRDRRGLAGELAPLLLARDLPDLTDGERALAAGFVDESVAAMPDVLRVGFRLAGRVTGLALRVAGGGRFSGRSLPLVSEYGSAVRDLGLVAVVESRHSSADVP